jgi:hypothetical protein
MRPPFLSARDSYTSEHIFIFINNNKFVNKSGGRLRKHTQRRAINIPFEISAPLELLGVSAGPCACANTCACAVPPAESVFSLSGLELDGKCLFIVYLCALYTDVRRVSRPRLLLVIVCALIVQSTYSQRVLFK